MCANYEKDNQEMNKLEVDVDPETNQRTSTIVSFNCDEIITHDGIFHADEVFAIAIIHSLVEDDIPVRRTRKVTNEELNNPRIWVLDQYGRHEPELHNFDHHQSKLMDSTNCLVLDYLYKEQWIGKDIWKALLTPYMAISEYDIWGPKGKNVGAPFNGFQVNEFIKSLNNLSNGFDLALTVARMFIDSKVAFINKQQESANLWDNGEVISANIRLCKAYPILWQSYNEEKILIAPEAGLWKVYSSDTARYPITTTGKEVFIHTNKFIAGYNSKEDAVEAALVTISPPLTGGI